VAKKATKRRIAADRAAAKVCTACGAENAGAASACIACGKKRFEPEWVEAHHPLNRQFSVQITKSNPEFGEVTSRVTLNKWWPGGRATFHIPTADQWRQVQGAINGKFGPKLGWTPADTLVARATKTGIPKAQAKESVSRLASEYPSLLKDLASAIDPEKLSRQDFRTVVDTLGEISNALGKANAGFREAFLSVVRKLPTQKQEALQNLALLLEGWSLNVITNVAQQVRSRLETIELFEKQIQDARTFEIRGDNSIHRILERAMWLIDEHYWLLHSNATLRLSIGEEMARKDKELYGDMRPDFVCGTVGDKLIVLELKRPAHALTADDLNQLETYMTVAETYSNFRSSKGFLVGARTDEELKRRLKYRSGFEVLHYADIIDATRKRYHEYLETLEADAMPVTKVRGKKGKNLNKREKK
jgi:hypothetical protein